MQVIQVDVQNETTLKPTFYITEADYKNLLVSPEIWYKGAALHKAVSIHKTQ